MCLSPAEVRLIASSRNWIEGSATQQLEKTATLPGMLLAAGMPDLHPGKGSPIGAAFLTQNRIYPTLVGNDIGCGIALWRTSLSAKKLKREAWADKLSRGLVEPRDPAEWLARHNVNATGYEPSLGTIGSGNHFAELQVCDGDPNVYLLVHSGSRGFGEAILREHVDRFAGAGLHADADDARHYLARHDHAVAWARVNRACIAACLLARIHAEVEEQHLDICHNSVEPLAEGRFLHRKGAAPADKGPVVIPGSRGTHSYLVTPHAEQAAMKSASSLAHGAGRKWARSDARGRLEKRYQPRDLERTDLGSVVICHDRDLLYEEAPQAYKDIAIVIDDLLQAGLIEVDKILKPVLTFKVAKS